MNLQTLSQIFTYKLMVLGLSVGLAADFHTTSAIANQGNASVQFNLGVMYDEDNGVAQDTAKAFEWYQKSAEQGNASAQFNIVWMYEHADGVSQDSVKAVEWYRKAADKGDVESQFGIRIAYKVAVFFLNH